MVLGRLHGRLRRYPLRVHRERGREQARDGRGRWRREVGAVRVLQRARAPLEGSSEAAAAELRRRDRLRRDVAEDVRGQGDRSYEGRRTRARSMSVGMTRRSSRRARRAGAIAVGAIAGAAFSCTRGAGHARRHRGVDHHREAGGAQRRARCAPRELAMAKSHLSFASVELDQGCFVRPRSTSTSRGEHARRVRPLAAAEVRRAPVRRGAPPPKPGDRDGDGLLDPQDEKCPCAETWNGFQDDDGCPDDPDTDGDGLTDARRQLRARARGQGRLPRRRRLPRARQRPRHDPRRERQGQHGQNCANDPEDPDGYEDADGCPEPDNDQDTVVDLEDQCPNEPGDGRRQAGLPEEAEPGHRHREGDQDHAADPLRVRQGQDPAARASRSSTPWWRSSSRTRRIKIEIQGHTDKGHRAPRPTTRSCRIGVRPP